MLCGNGEPSNVARRVYSRRNVIDHATVVNFRTDLAPKLILLYNPQMMVELTRDDLGLPLVLIEVLLFAGNFQVTAAGEVALDTLVFDNLLNALNRLQRRRVHLLRLFSPVHVQVLAFVGSDGIEAGQSHIW